jgi:regulator of sirC expression with transglutaminase-like and TPR domain
VAEQSVEKVALAASKSVVVIAHSDRAGRRSGIGAGFLIRPDGLIATNLHVIGEGRPIEVRFADGSRRDVVEVVAADRDLDLALIKVDGEKLPILEMGDANALHAGQIVVAIGNPLGFEHSVVTGVVSAVRSMEDRRLIQVSLPIEPGNSGGPLLDLKGRVVGILTLKSLVAANLGFAVPINAIVPLMARPNPVPITRWLAISALDRRDWHPLMGANWRRRGGRIAVDGFGEGFGGRSLCLAETSIPERPYEVAVAVRLEDESGAAGLAFCADGGDRHYGFYPSNHQLRLTRFDGPTVQNWTILAQVASAHYRPGEFNSLKVRLLRDKILCFVNDNLVIESKDAGLTSGKAGLAKFRNTRAEFKGFRVGAVSKPMADHESRLGQFVAGLKDPAQLEPADWERLIAHPEAALLALRSRAGAIENQAAQLHRLANAVHQKAVQKKLTELLKGDEGKTPLVRCALLVSKLDNDDLDVAGYERIVDRLADDLKAKVSKDADEPQRLAALNRFLFEDLGFRGSRTDYYHRANSYLNEVLDDREGIPLTLSVLYMELGSRIGLELVGIGLPRHFVVEHVSRKGERQLIDVFEGGKPISRNDAAKKVLALEKRPLRDSDLQPVPKQAIITRMLANLYHAARTAGESDSMLRYLDTLLALNPDDAGWRSERAVRRFIAGQRQGAIEDADWLLERRPDGIDVERLLEFRRTLAMPN